MYFGATGIQKETPFRSKALTNAARGQSCVNCGAEDGTVVHAHLAWPGIAPRGMSMKCDDFWGAHLCYRCHQSADSGEFHTDLFWRTMIVRRTLWRLFDQGVLTVATSSKKGLE